MSETPDTVLFGAGGFIGTALRKAFSVRAIPLTRKDADFTNAEAMAALAPAIPQELHWVVAAARNPDASGAAEQCLADNVAMAKNIAALIPTCAPRSVVFLSSIDVYGRTGLALPLYENSPLHPETPYAESKVQSEQIVRDACGAVPCTILRLPGVYGPGDTHRGPVSSFVSAALAEEELTIFGDGEQQRDLLFIDDLVRGINDLLGDPPNGVFNFVRGESVSLNTMIALLSEIAGRDLPVRKNPAPQFDLRFRPSPLGERLRFRPFAQGLRATFEAERVRAGMTAGSR